MKKTLKLLSLSFMILSLIFVSACSTNVNDDLLNDDDNINTTPTTINLTISNANILSGEYTIGDVISITSTLDSFGFWYTGDNGYNKICNIISYSKTFDYTIPNEDVVLKQEQLRGIGLYASSSSADASRFDNQMITVLGTDIEYYWSSMDSVYAYTTVTDNFTLGGVSYEAKSIDTEGIVNENYSTCSYIAIYGFIQINGNSYFLKKVLYDKNFFLLASITYTYLNNDNSYTILTLE